MAIGDGSMFSKYDEISKLIRNYIEASLAKENVDVAILNKYLMDKYKISLSHIDTTNLVNKISFAKKRRKEYEARLQNHLKQEEETILELKQQENMLLEEEGRVREFGYALANKICIMLYKGPLTIDTIKELKEHNYDGSYGNITMMHMYALYNQNKKLEIESAQLKADIARKDQLVNAFQQQYTKQYNELTASRIQNNGLASENANLRESNKQIMQCLSDQSLALQMMNQNIVAFTQSYTENKVLPTMNNENKTIELQKTA